MFKMKFKAQLILACIGSLYINWGLVNIQKLIHFWQWGPNSPLGSFHRGWLIFLSLSPFLLASAFFSCVLICYIESWLYKTATLMYGGKENLIKPLILKILNFSY